MPGRGISAMPTSVKLTVVRGDGSGLAWLKTKRDIGDQPGEAGWSGTLESCLLNQEFNL